MNTFPDGLWYKYGDGNTSPVSWYSASQVLNGTGTTSFNPAIAVNRSSSSNPPLFQLAWEEDVSSSQSNINYSSLTASTNNTITQSTPANISSGDGMTLNYRPSIIALADTTARVCWAGDLDGTGQIVQAVFHDPGYYRYWGFGSIIKSPTVTFSDDNSRYVVSWNETLNNSNANKFTDSRTLSAIYDLGINGNAVQISNGAAASNMYGTIFNSSTAPYYFSTSNSIGSIAPKVNANAASIGRGVVLTKDNAQFYFMLGNISVDNSPVGFIDVPRKARFDSLQALNNCIITAPFTLSGSSNFSYSVLSGITDTAAAVSALGKNGFVSFDVVKSNLAPEISVGQTKLTMIDSYSNGNIMGKSTSKPISYQSSNEIKSYKLDQNYPNPFNPSTAISYQLSADSYVTLKVYDILGNLVKTLVNQYQNKGKYDINFDARKLASGIYFYRLNVINPANQSQNYFTVKKMMLIK